MFILLLLDKIVKFSFLTPSLQWVSRGVLECSPDRDVPGTAPNEVLEGSRADLPGMGLGVPTGEGAVVKGEGDSPGRRFNRENFSLNNALKFNHGSVTCLNYSAYWI